MPKQIQEGSTFTFRARFYNSQNALTAPDSVEYRIYDKTNERTVLDWTSVTPAADLEVEVPADLNWCHQQSARKKFEHRLVIVRANGEQDTQRHQPEEYWISNIPGLTSDT